jgi:hypothetical protein
MIQHKLKRSWDEKHAYRTMQTEPVNRIISTQSAFTVAGRQQHQHRNQSCGGQQGMGRDLNHAIVVPDLE